jgi:hypothetical protein
MARREKRQPVFNRAESGVFALLCIAALAGLAGLWSGELSI